MDRRLEKWGRTRAKGRWSFVLKFGVLGWGLSTALIYSMFVCFMDPASHPFDRTLLLSLAFLLPGGLAWGLVMWRLNEKAWLKAGGNPPGAK